MKWQAGNVCMEAVTSIRILEVRRRHETDTIKSNGQDQPGA